MLKRVTRLTVAFGRYPPPTSEGWTSIAIDELAHDLLLEKGGPQGVVAVLSRAENSHEVHLLLRRLVRNYLADRARRTPSGKLHRRLRRILSEDPRFYEVGSDTWALEPTQDATFTMDDDSLFRRASRRSHDAIAAWRTRSNSSIATSLLSELCLAILDEANAPVGVATLRRVVARLLGIVASPVDAIPADPDDLALTAGGNPPKGPAATMALELWESMTDRERTLLPYLRDPVRQVAMVIGTGHTQAAVALSRLRRHIRTYIEDEDQATRRMIIAHLLELYADWSSRPIQ